MNIKTSIYDFEMVVKQIWNIPVISVYVGLLLSWYGYASVKCYIQCFSDTYLSVYRISLQHAKNFFFLSRPVMLKQKTILLIFTSSWFEFLQGSVWITFLFCQLHYIEVLLSVIMGVIFLHIMCLVGCVNTYHQDLCSTVAVTSMQVGDCFSFI